MKIVCDACSAKYSIADDKVKGKVFKIRCKKCSNIIVVRGTAGASDEPPAPQFDQKDTRVYDYGYDEGAAGAAGAAAAGGDDAVWHLVIDQEQVGPLSVAEVQQRFAQGQIDSESYVWREGFADWQPLASVDVFAHLAAGGGGGGAAAVANMFGSAGADEGGTVRSNPDDLFAAAGRGGDDGGDDAGDLFGARAAAPASRAAAPDSDDDYDKPSSRGGAAAAGGGKLRGERNENSVLFSLGNLAALASDAPRASAPSSSSSSATSSGGAAQHGGGEGSGLIDIRSMASAYLGAQGAQKKTQSNVGSIDDLPVFSASAFSEPAVIMPTPGGARQNNKTMVILMAAVAALAVITLVLVLVVVLGGDKDSGQAPQVASNTDDGDKDDGDGKGTAAEGVTPDDPEKKDGTGPGTAAEPPADPTKSADPAEKTPDPSEKKADTSEKKSDKRDDRRDSRRDDKKDDKKEEKKVEDKPAPSGNCPDEVGCLLSEKPPSCCSKYSKGGKKKTEEKKDSGGGGGGGGGDLPESIDSGMVKGGVAKVKSKIFACGDKYPSAKGTLKLSVKVNAKGKVTDVSVVSSPDSGLGSCAASAMKGASFPETQRGGSFKYPFNF